MAQMDKASWIWLCVFKWSMLLQCFLRSCWKLFSCCQRPAGLSSLLLFLREPKLSYSRWEGGMWLCFLVFSMFAFLPSFLCVRVWEELFCITPTLLPTYFLHFSEWRSWSQPCLPRPLDAHNCVQGGARVRTGWWQLHPILNLLLDQS